MSCKKVEVYINRNDPYIFGGFDAVLNCVVKKVKYNTEIFELKGRVQNINERYKKVSEFTIYEKNKFYIDYGMGSTYIDIGDCQIFNKYFKIGISVDKNNTYITKKEFTEYYQFIIQKFNIYETRWYYFNKFYDLFGKHKQKGRNPFT